MNSVSSARFAQRPHSHRLFELRPDADFVVVGFVFISNFAARTSAPDTRDSGMTGLITHVVSSFTQCALGERNVRARVTISSRFCARRLRRAKWRPDDLDAFAAKHFVKGVGEFLLYASAPS
jgi:hypothetical protein